jgi:hypothetical protein
MVEYFSDADRIELPLIEKERYRRNRSVGIEDKARVLDHTESGIFGEVACMRQLGGTSPPEGRVDPGYDLMRIERGEEVTYSIKTGTQRHYEWGLLPHEVPMKADRGILVLPLTDDITIAAELLGWFERETFEENWHRRDKGGKAHPDSRWLKNSYLIKPYVLLIEPCDGGTYAAINEEYQSRVKYLPKAEQAKWHEDNGK